MTAHLPSPRCVVATAATLALGATAAMAGGCGGAAPSAGARSAEQPAIASGSDAPRNGRIVFQRLDPDTGKIRLYTVRPNGSGLRAITLPGAGEDMDSLPDWSPDGRRIAFRRFFHTSERTDVLVVNRDGTGLRNLTRGLCTGDCLGDEEASWSPDGRQIAFIRAVGPLPPDGPPPTVGVFVMDAGGSDARQLTQLQPGSGTEDHAPAWSPDGRRIAFMRSNNTKSPQDQSAIYTVNADGTGLRLVRRMPREWPGAGAPDWSPDGRRLLFSTYCYFGNCGQPSTGAQLFTIDPNGGRPRQLTHLPGNSYNGAWSPDGKKIVFARNRVLGPEGDIYTMNADGTRVRRVTRTPKLDAHAPDWGRRGR